MIPAWIWTLLVVTVGCIVAMWLGSALPEVDGYDALELIFVAAACFLCAAYNNFPFLLALGSWIPFFPHILGPASFPTIGFFLIWIGGVLFFRLCVQGYISYRLSFNWFLIIVFCWVPIRFALNPVTKLGATAGGSGVSGALPYFNYAFAAACLIFLGAVLTDRSKIMYFMRWCFRVVLYSGGALFLCAFIPATGPILEKLGTFSAGDIGEGVQRLVVLPGYGLFLLEVSLCPSLFGLSARKCMFVFLLGLGMMVVGGNRSAMAAAVIVIPIVLFLRRQSHGMALALFLMFGSVLCLRLVVATMDPGNIPPMMRSFAIFDAQIENSVGGESSAQWRYAVWRSGWKVIMENPLTGKGFGNLPENVDPSAAAESGDFEMVLAGGESHNGFVNAAYGFGIPFMLALSAAIVLYFFKEAALALTTDQHDPELRDLHAFLAGMFTTYPILIYTAFDMSVCQLWTYISVSAILSNLPRRELTPQDEGGIPLRKYGEEPRPAGQYSYRPR